jgi:hypothetical protein
MDADSRAEAVEPTSTPPPADADPPAEARLLRLQLSAEDLASFEKAAGKHSQSIESWAEKALRRAIADS